MPMAYTCQHPIGEKVVTNSECYNAHMARPRGAKGKFEDARLQVLYNALSQGMTIKSACALAGIHQSTYFEWVTNKPEFTELVKRAESEMKERALKVINQAAQNGQWQAAAWLLERREPNEYGRQDRVRIEDVRGTAEKLAEKIGVTVEELLAEVGE